MYNLSRSGVCDTPFYNIRSIEYSSTKAKEPKKKEKGTYQIFIKYKFGERKRTKEECASGESVI